MAKTRIESSELIRISTRTFNIAKKNKKKTGVPIGKFVEDLILATVKKGTDEKNSQTYDG